MLIRQAWLGLIVAGVLSVQGAYAADPAEKDVADKAASDKAESKDQAADRYDVPVDGDVKELLAFIKSIREFVPKTLEERRKHQIKSAAAIKAAAEQVQEIATEEDKQLDGYEEALSMLLFYRARSALSATDEELARLTDDLKAAFESSSKPKPYLLAAASSLASSFEYGGKPEQAAKLYGQLGDVLAKHDDPETARRGASMQGAVRRLNLKGQPLKIHGTQMDGSTLDWGSYRGRVVLVDFWATWCGPCLREIPNVKKNYEAYHDKGFEVVAISLDEDRAKLETFLEKDPKPWVTLHDGGWSENDVATYYGIVGIPTVILVDKDGKVVSTRARGPELGRLLADLLGPAEEENADDAAAEKDSAKESG